MAASLGTIKPLIKESLRIDVKKKSKYTPPMILAARFVITVVLMSSGPIDLVLVCERLVVGREKPVTAPPSHLPPPFPGSLASLSRGVVTPPGGATSR